MTWRWLLLIVPLALVIVWAWHTRDQQDDWEDTRAQWKRMVPPKDDADEQ